MGRAKKTTDACSWHFHRPEALKSNKLTQHQSPTATRDYITPSTLSLTCASARQVLAFHISINAGGALLMATPTGAVWPINHEIEAGARCARRAGGAGRARRPMSRKLFDLLRPGRRLYNSKALRSFFDDCFFREQKLTTVKESTL